MRTARPSGRWQAQEGDLVARSRLLTAMTLTKVVLPEYCSPTSVSSISSFQKSERNQSSRREMSASMAAAGSERGRARTTADTASHERISAPNPPTAPRRVPRRDSGGHKRAAATARARKPSGSYDSPYPPPTPGSAQPRKRTARAARPGGFRAPAVDSATGWWDPSTDFSGSAVNLLCSIQSMTLSS